MDKSMAFWAVVVMVAVNMMLRYLPFLIFRGGKKTPKIISYLGEVLPYAIIGMLIIYCIKDISFTSVAGFAPLLIACAVTAGLHLLAKNTLVSIICGTVSYMVLVQYVFV